MDNSELNLKVLPSSDFQNEILQKCLLPGELFPKNILPGHLAKCIFNSNEISVCRIYPMQNKYPKNYCILDKTVTINKLENNESVLLKVEPLSHFIVEDIANINVCLTINAKAFRDKLSLNKDFFKKILKTYLSNYFLIDTCVVNANNFLKSFGISQILINSEYNFPFQIDLGTNVNISDVKLEKDNSVRISKLKGLNTSILELKKFFKDFQLQKNIGWEIKPSFNALIIGPPGSGKTSICHNFFIENSVNVFNIRSAEIIRQYPGETEEILRKVFENAKYFVKEFKPNGFTVIYIEDIELICPLKTNDADVAHKNRITAQFISLLDNLYSLQSEINVIATTSQIDAVTDQLRRPGRFEKEILISIPNESERIEIIELLLRNTPLVNSTTEELTNYVAKRTPGYVGADIIILVQNVIKLILREKQCFDIDLINLKTYFDDAMKTFRPTSIRSSDVSVFKCKQKFDDIGGMTDLKKTLQVTVLTALRHPESFERFGLELPKGILFYGPPGCAKTTIAKCLAAETNMTFISTSGAEVYSPYVGNAEKFIVKIFDTARKNSPCIIFFDEIETLVGKRTLSSKSDVQTRILSTLLTEMDGIGLKMQSAHSQTNKYKNHVLVIGATNRPDMIDDALLRPGRFDKLIHVPAPDFNSRLAILEIYKQKMPFDKNIDFKSVAEQTVNFSGADLCNLCNEAAIHALTENFEVTNISYEDFKLVLTKLKPSLSNKQIEWYYNFENKYVT